jgi:anti-sigma factor ChrR (cupin superfamily)
MKELSKNYNEMTWEDTGGYPSGTKVKILRKEGDSQTFLLKLPPGFTMHDHSHMATEQHFVIDGEYESDCVKYACGSYRLIPAHTNHGPFISEHGATVLVVWTL